LSTKRGNYYRLKTKKWLQAKGYHVETVEHVQRIYDGKNNKVIFVKRDVLAADLIAVSADAFILVNSKLGRKNIASGIKDFHKYPCPPFVDRWLVVWEPRVREPEVVVVDSGTEPDPSVEAPEMEGSVS